MDKQETPQKRQANLHTKRPKGRPKFRWKNDVENDITGYVIWRQVVQNRDGWGKESGAARILLG